VGSDADFTSDDLPLNMEMMPEITTIVRATASLLHTTTSSFKDALYDGHNPSLKMVEKFVRLYMNEVDATEKNYTELLLNCSDKFSVLIR
jgi:hypothetical protein